MDHPLVIDFEIKETSHDQTEQQDHEPRSDFCFRWLCNGVSGADRHAVHALSDIPERLVVFPPSAALSNVVMITPDLLPPLIRCFPAPRGS